MRINQINRRRSPPWHSNWQSEPEVWYCERAPCVPYVICAPNGALWNLKVGLHQSWPLLLISTQQRFGCYDDRACISTDGYLRNGLILVTYEWHVYQWNCSCQCQHLSLHHITKWVAWSEARTITTDWDEYFVLCSPLLWLLSIIRSVVSEFWLTWQKY